MSYVYAPLIGLLVGLLSLTCPVLTLFALPFVRWDAEADEEGVIRGDLPAWLSWLSTPDERLPGGMYEAAHKELYLKYGKWVASWYWLGVRNRLFGLSGRLGIPAEEFIPDVRGWYRKGRVWQWSTQLGVTRFVVGYQVYRPLKGELYATPVFSIKLRM